MNRKSLDVSRAWPVTGCQGVFRERIEDFRVDEELGFELAGTGEHVFLRIEKTNLNTEEVARRIAKYAGVRQMDVGYSGMKDRRAIARQWFSIYLSNRPEPDWQGLEADDLKILQHARHTQKLRRGQHVGNRFEICIRELTGDRTALESVLVQLRDQGFPNYFGEQRFGIRGANLDRAENLFQGDLRQRDRHKRSIYLSAARSWLFNQVLSRRVSDGVWNREIAGDTLVDVPKQNWNETVSVPSGPLYGDAPVSVTAEAGRVEQQIADEQPLFIDGLKAQRIRPERRPLVAFPMGLDWSIEGGTLTLRFALTSGSFATAMLQECLELTANWYEKPQSQVSDGETPGGDEQAGDDQ